MRRRMTHLERAQRAIARNQRKIERINIAIPCASGKRLATLEDRKKRAEKLVTKWTRMLDKSRTADRRYRVIWKRDDKGTRGVLAPGPFTHREAVAVLRKQRPQPWRRDLLEEFES